MHPEVQPYDSLIYCFLDIFGKEVLANRKIEAIMSDLGFEECDIEMATRYLFENSYIESKDIAKALDYIYNFIDELPAKHDAKKDKGYFIKGFKRFIEGHDC